MAFSTNNKEGETLPQPQKVKVERSAGAILFRKRGNKILYLLLQHTRGHWAFPKGHIEKGESSLEAARREILEEANIARIRFFPGYKETIKFRFKWPPKSPDAELRLKFVVFYLGQVFDARVKISEEHKGFQWVSFEKGMKILKHRNVRELLSHAHERITHRRPRMVHSSAKQNPVTRG